jgi:hypothetical protein
MPPRPSFTLRRSAPFARCAPVDLLLHVADVGHDGLVEPGRNTKGRTSSKKRAATAPSPRSAAP